jgi:hypothetical protein
MKKFLLIATVAATALVQAQPSEAYFRGKWCAKMDAGGGSVGERCASRTLRPADPTSTPSRGRSAFKTSGTRATGASATTGRNSNSTAAIAEKAVTPDEILDSVK